MKVILFDFFGVLSTPAYMEVIKKFIPIVQQADWIKKLDVLDSGEMSEEQLVSEISAYSQISPAEIWMVANRAPKLNQKLINFIKNDLKIKFKVGLLTNIPRSLLERILKEELNLFDFTFISSELKLIKPDKRIFEVAVSKVGFPVSEILFVDDGQRNVEVASSLGINVILYQNFNLFLKEVKKYI
jgi:HAD superfamily hydrolase (TIGR01509 family)